jgi:preprotein translocase subunit SecA
VITIATNMAGRGTDIVLGGNVEKQVQFLEADESIPKTRRPAASSSSRTNGRAERPGQGRGRPAHHRHRAPRVPPHRQPAARPSGRQGDPGSSRFYLSLDDPLMRIFAGDRVRAIMDRLKMPEGEAIEAGIVNRSIESAQRKVEARNFDIRKQLLEYDDVSNDQRKVIYQQRNEILDADSLTEQITNLREATMTEVVRTYVPADSLEEQWDLPAWRRRCARWQLEVPLVAMVEASDSVTDEDVLEKVLEAADAAFQAKLDLVGEEQFKPFSAWCCCSPSTPTGASTWPRWTTCARASTCAATPRRTPSRNTSARPSSCSPSCWTWSRWKSPAC